MAPFTRTLLVAATLLAATLMNPAFASGPDDLQDDAGSGQDAPETPTPEIRIQSGDVHWGMVTDWVVDPEDYYAFEANAGDVVQARATSGLGYFSIRDAHGNVHARTVMVAYYDIFLLTITVPETGIWYLHFTTGAGEPNYYRFSLGINEDAPPTDFRPSLDAPDAAGALPPVTPASESDEHTVIAVVDTGVNVYHEFFRAPGLQNHPSTWLPGFPADAETLNLSLEAPNLALARGADDPLWTSVQPTRYMRAEDAYDTHLYTFPGTRVVGAVSFSEFAPGDTTRPILDDMGHGTASAGLAAGANLPLADGNVLIVMIEANGETFAQAVGWAARQPWIDAISASIGTAGHTATTGTLYGDPNEMEWATLEAARSGKPLFFASGNGWANTAAVPDQCHTYLSPYTGPSWVTRIGAADPATGDPTVWHCRHVDAIARTNAPAPSDQGMAEVRVAGGTSASAPNAAGHFAHLLLDARRAALDVSRAEALTHLLNASEPSTLPLGGLTHPTVRDEGYGLIDADALERAKDTLRAGEPTPRPEMEDWMAADRAVRDTFWGPGKLMDLRGGPTSGLQNDAGSGEDAPNAADPSFLIESGIVYEGFQDGWVDVDDWYAFHGEAGDVVEVRVAGLIGCMYLMSPLGGEVGSNCTTGYALNGAFTVTLEETGVHYVHYLFFQPQHYQFSVGVNEPAPGPFVVNVV